MVRDTTYGRVFCLNRRRTVLILNNTRLREHISRYITMFVGIILGPQGPCEIFLNIIYHFFPYLDAMDLFSHFDDSWPCLSYCDAKYQN
jgi:hypothetical protein